VADSPTAHYLNSDFDLSLRPRPRQVGNPALVRQVRELSVQALLGASDRDSVLVRAEVPREFLAHLAESGLPVPRLLRHPEVDPVAHFRPFGWSAEAIELNRLHERPAEHPPLSSIRRVNSRSLALELEADLAPEGPSGTVVESPAELDAFLARAPAAIEWVVKSEHGHAGLANRRLGRPRLTPADRRFVDDRFAEDDRLVVEPWLARERDWCVVFDVPFDRSALRVHETLCTRDGALIGALFDPGGDPGTWSEDLAATAERVASKLDAEGYFGAVCVDAFTWREGDRLRLRPFVDLNCRRSMSDGAYRLWRRWAPERTLYYRFFNRRKLSLPAELPRALAALGQHRYDRAERRGILLVSPLQLGAAAQTWRPGKVAVIFVADERSGVFELERWFRDRFEA
jgi:hypothetical protein